MRHSLRSAFVLSCFILAASTFASADPIYPTITLSMSTIATGTFGTQPFTNSLVTFTVSFSAAELLNCTDIGCPFPEDGNYYSVDEEQGGNFTIGVAGIGTYGAVEDVDVSFMYNPPDLEGIQVTGFYPQSGRLSFDQYLYLYIGQNCYDNLLEGECPTSASTYGGTLYLTSYDGSFTSENIVTDAQSPVPKPSTFTLLCTGLIGTVSFLRRAGRSRVA